MPPGRPSAVRTSRSRGGQRPAGPVRHLAQFGIGLLACFTVADQIRVVTRSAREAEAKTVEWLAKSDGTYGVRILDGAAARPEPGTTVYLAARPGAERWFEPARVTALARDYGELLPCEVTVESSGQAVRTSERVAVWERPHVPDTERACATTSATAGPAATHRPPAPRASVPAELEPLITPDTPPELAGELDNTRKQLAGMLEELTDWGEA